MIIIFMIYMVCTQLQMLLFPNDRCCSLYERNCVCAVTKSFTKFLPANNFCQLLQVTRKRSCTLGMINRGRLELATSPINSVCGLVCLSGLLGNMRSHVAQTLRVGGAWSNHRYRLEIPEPVPSLSRHVK